MYWFCHKSTWIHHRYIYTSSPSWTPLPPPSLHHPSGSSQCNSPKHPVSCIEPGLEIRVIYDIIHVSMPFLYKFMHNDVTYIHHEMISQSRFNAWYWMLGAGALRWPKVMVQGGRRERGFRMGNTCIPVADSCWCMAKQIQYCKVINLQLK